MLEEKTRKTEEAAQKAFPNEKWYDVATLKLKNKGEEFEIPPGVKNIYVARSRLTGKKEDERTLVKEIRQGKILADMGDVIFLLPKLRAPDGKYIKGPDAVVNGALFEFKNITGPIKKVERNFRKSRYQSENVFLVIADPAISKGDVLTKIKTVLNNPLYKGGTKGHLVFHLAQTQRTYFMRIKDLK